MDFHRGTFRVRGDCIDIFPASYTDHAIRVEFWGDEIEKITEVDALTGNVVANLLHAFVFPASHYVVEGITMEKAIDNIKKDMAVEVLKATMPVIAQMEIKTDRTVRMYSKKFKLYADVPTKEAAEKIAKEAKENCGIDGTKWLEEVQRLNDCGIKRQDENAEVQYFRIEDWCLCGVPYELMVEFANDAQKILQNEFFYLNGYTNGCLSYFPMEEEFDRGGYEVYWSMLLYYSYFGRVFPFEREAATKLLMFVVKE